MPFEFDHPFVLKNAKQRLSRQLNILVEYLQEAQDFRNPWGFPTQAAELETFLYSNKIFVQNLISRLEQKKEHISSLYDNYNCMMKELEDDERANVEKEFDSYWIEKKGDEILLQAEQVERQLEKRLLELECQELSLKQTITNNLNQSLNQPQSTRVTDQAPFSLSSERRLLGNELKIPTFYGNSSEFGPFWELFEELVHKQPYSNIEKLAILIGCCKGDAARTLQMIPRTGESYERAVMQLKNQYDNPRQVTMQMIRQLKSLKQTREDHRSLRNNLNDIQAIIGTLEKQGELIDTTNMKSMVLDTFSQKVQEEMAKKEFDSGKVWSMRDLLENLNIAVKRKEHVESLREINHEEHSVLHTSISSPIVRCTGCGQPHKFQYCDIYRTTAEKIERMKMINACWKCLSRNHRTQFCRKQNCPYCGGMHNLILCRRMSKTPIKQGSTPPKWRSTTRRMSTPSRKSRLRSYSPLNPYKNRGNSPNRQGLGTGADAQTSRHQSNSHFRNKPTRSAQPNFRSSSGTPERQRVRFRESPTPRSRSPEHITVNLQLGNGVRENIDNTMYQSRKEGVHLMIVPILLRHSDSEQMVRVYGLIDSASDQSFISEFLVQRLNLETQRQTTIVVNTFGGRAEKRKVKKVITQLYNSQNNSITIEFLTSDKITPHLRVGHLPHQDISFIQEKYLDFDTHLISHTKDITVMPEILIGMDYFNTIMFLQEPAYRLPSGLFVTSTFFGPVVLGVPQEEDEKLCQDTAYEHIVQMCTAHNDKEQDLDISNLWKLSTIGIEDMNSEEEINERIISEFYSTVQLQENRIFVRFPWKPNKDSLANNYSLALSRLHQLFKMKNRNPQCWKEYCSIIEEQLKKGFIEEAPQLSQLSNSAPCYYIPHQAVIKMESATTKTRIVLDASSKMKGELSLNDVIYQGPLILPNLCGILIRSRIGSKVMIADVEKAFHMIYLQETERDAVRFLWLKDTTLPPTPNNLRVLRFCRLPFGINASPFLLGISIKYGIEKQSGLEKTLRKQLSDNLYVDNVLLTDNSTQSLIQKYRLCKQIFSNISMNLRQFLTNDEILNTSIPPNDLSTSKTPKILGVPWDHKKDLLTVICKLQYTTESTKRIVLQAANSTFDPLGLLAPLLLPAKLFLQELWKRELKWDDPLPATLDCEWKTICENAAGYQATIPRTITSSVADDRYELHTFVDASIRSYVATVYLRAINYEGVICSTLVMARQRLAPINKKSKTVTIPRLELLALLIGVRLTDFVLHEIQLPVQKIHIYSDSQVALHWVQSNNKNGVFVDNRCKEVRERIKNWSTFNIHCHLYYIPSEINPADCATKGLTKQQMVNHEWWNGPYFLQQDNVKWPKLQEFLLDKTESSSVNEHNRSHVVLSSKTTQVCNINSLLLPKEFSSMSKYKRVMAIILKYLKVKIYNKLSKKLQANFEKAIPEIVGVSTAEPLALLRAVDQSAAGRILIREMQKTITQEQLEKWDYLEPYVDDNGLLRCYGRLKTPHLTQETLHPILLPPNHNLTFLLVRETHGRCGHQGVNGTLANIRRTYWIPKGRQVVKRCLKSCLVCKKWNSKPYFYPNSPPLPCMRTQPSRPFSHVGIDLAGPFNVHNTEKMEFKRWIFLTTCMVTRAVHLEVVNNLTGKEVINVLRKIIARRGKPQLMISDNASNFTMGKDIIQTLTKQAENSSQEVQQFLANESIRWKFITPLSPWKGGFYERMIGVMKAILKKLMPRKPLNENDFVTLVTECEGMINSRPLTYTGSTPEDSVVIRPIDFLIPYSNVNLLPPLHEEEDEEYQLQSSTKDEVLRYFNKHIKYLNQLWKFWTDNYLLELRNFHQRRIKQKTFTRKQPHIGEVVLVMEQNTPRGEWPLGLVMKLIEDNDGNVRSVELRTVRSNVIRPINMLIPLELDADKDLAEEKSLEEINGGTPATADVKGANGAVNNGKASAAAPACEAQRSRIFLPRHAKENRAYNINTVETKGERNNRHQYSIPWQRWLLLATLASLCTNARATNRQDNPIHCIRGGVIIQTSQSQDKLQICANDYCVEINQPDKNLKVQFPAEITLHSHQVIAKLQEGNSTQAFQQTCPQSPFCEQITCTFCTTLVTNPECWPRLAITVTAILLYAIILTTYVTIRSMRRIGKAFTRFFGKRSGLRNLLKRRTKNQRRSRQSSNESIPLIEINNNANRRWNTSTIIRVLSILTACYSTTYACQQTITIPSHALHCHSNEGKCTNQTTLVAKFNTMETELCLQLKHREYQRHLMKITVQQLILRCQKETLYFTRNTQTQVQYRKRCPHMGTCSGLKCAKISTNTLVDELDIANNFTGITYCSESCGGLGCSCGFPSSGCLFYRIYHVPLDNNIYEIFQCPSWYTTARLKIEYTNNVRGSKTYSGEMQPYTTQLFGSTEIELTAYSYPPITLLNKRFITNRKTTAYLTDEYSFSYACLSKPNTFTDGNCSIKDTCNCNPAENSVTCYCTHNNVSQTTQLSNLLPLPLPNTIIDADSKGLPKVYTSSFSAELAIRLDPTIIQTIQNVQNFNCDLIPATVTGCYSCTKGATALIKCTTDVPHSTAQVSCGQQQFVLKCTKEGTQNEIKLFFNTARVKELCRVHCGSHTTVIQIAGTLNYIRGNIPLWRYTKLWNNLSSEVELNNFDWAFPDLNHFLEVCKTFYIYTVTVALIFSSAVLITTVYLCGGKRGTNRESTFSTSSFAFYTPPTLAAMLPFLILRRVTRAILYLIRIPFRFIRTLLNLV